MFGIRRKRKAMVFEDPGITRDINDMERYRDMFLSLISVRENKQSLWVVVSSAQRREGVSTISRGLSKAMAQSGPTILLEMNWRHPSPETARVSNRLALSDLMSKQKNMQPSQAIGFQMLTVVSADSHGGPVDGDNLIKLVDWLRPHFYFGVVDAPPVLLYPEALMLGKAVDGCILVVESGNTAWPDAARARDLVRSAGITPMGVVLNKRRYPVPERIYRRLR